MSRGTCKNCGICSVEEIGSFAEPASSSRESKKLSPHPVNGKNGNYGGPKVRDRLCQLIRQHQLDANLVKSYAVDFCGTKILREASREAEAIVAHLAYWAEKDRNALLCQLNSYPGNQESAAVAERPRCDRSMDTSHTVEWALVGFHGIGRWLIREDTHILPPADVIVVLGGSLPYPA